MTRARISHLILVMGLPLFTGSCQEDISTNVKALLLKLSSAEPDSRIYAALKLGGLSGNASAAIPALLKMMRRGNAREHSAAVLALGFMGQKAVPFLVEALKDEDPRVQEGAVEAMGEIIPESSSGVPALARLLKHPVLRVRWRAALALGEMEQVAAEGIPALIEALDDESAWVRWSAAQALGEMGAMAAAAVPALSRKLRDSEKFVRGRAMHALRKMGTRAQAAVPALIEILEGNQRDPLEREWAAKALYYIGPGAAAAVPALSRALKAGRARLKWWAATALGKMGAEAASALPVLKKMMAYHNKIMKKAVKKAVRYIQEQIKLNGK